MEQYGNMAKVYDKMIDMDYDNWIEFVERFLNSKGATLRGKSCIELGCGTGNMTLRLKQSGAEVIGLDISQDMLAIAEEKLRKKRYLARFINADMTDFNIDKKFDLAFSFCDGYNYILDDEELLNSFERVYKHLNKNGYFIFDVSTDYKLKSVIGSNTYTLNEDELCYIWDNYFEDDILDMYITFFQKEGNLYRRFDEHHSQKSRSIEDIIEYLKRSGFRNIKVFDDYSFKDISENSLRAAITAQREE